MRDRREDILPLARILLADAATRLGRDVTAFSPAVVEQFLRHHWPGNVRELSNVIERAVALAASDRVELDDLPKASTTALHEPPVSLDQVATLEEVKRDYILAVLDANDGSRTETARQLEIGSATLYRRLEAYERT